MKTDPKNKKGTKDKSAEEKYRELIEGAVYEVTDTLEQIYKKMSGMSEAKRKARIDEISKNISMAKIGDRSRLENELSMLQNFPMVRVRMGIIANIREKMQDQKNKNFEGATQKMYEEAEKEKEARKKIQLIEGIEQRIGELQAKINEKEADEHSKAKFTQRIKYLQIEKDKIGNIQELEAIISQVNETKGKANMSGVKTPEDKVIYACNRPWETILQGIEFKDIAKMTEQDIRKKLDIPEKQKEGKNKADAKNAQGIVSHTATMPEASAIKSVNPKVASNEKVTEKRAEQNSTVQKESSIRKFFEKMPIIGRAIKSISERAENRRKVKMLLEAQKQDKKSEDVIVEENMTPEEKQRQERIELRKRIMEKALGSSSEALKENEAEYRKVLSPEEFNWYVKEAIKREELESKRQLAIGAREETYKREQGKKKAEAEAQPNVLEVGKITRRKSIIETTAFGTRRRRFLEENAVVAKNPDDLSQVGRVDDLAQARAGSDGERIA